MAKQKTKTAQPKTADMAAPGAGDGGEAPEVTSTEAILARLEGMLAIEATEIAGLHLAPCRYCWGAGHNYQWTVPREYRRALAEALRKGGLPPRPDGGFGYRRDAGPNPDCPECAGQGAPVMRYPDPADWPAGAGDLIETLRPRGDGLEIRFRAKSTLLEHYARLKRLAAAEADNGLGAGAEAGVLVVPAKDAARMDITSLPDEEDDDDR